MKQHQPTEKKRERVKKEGLRPEAPFFRSALLLFLGIQIFIWNYPTWSKAGKTSFVTAVEYMAQTTLTRDSLVTLGRYILASLWATVGVFAASLFLSGVALFIAFRRLRPSRRQRWMGWSFSLYRSAFALASLVVVFLAAGGYGAWFYSQMSPGQMGKGAPVLLKFASALSWILLVMGFVDYGRAYQKFERDLHMTDEELREELRKEQGDPQIKSALREKIQGQR